MARKTPPQPTLDIEGVASATTPRRARRYNLDRAQRYFLTSRVLPAFIEQAQKNMTAMQSVEDAGGQGLLSGDVARSMRAQFANELERAHDALVQLSEGTLSGSDESDDDPSD